MKESIAILLAAMMAAIFAPARGASAQTAEAVQFKAADGATIFGWYYAAKTSAQPTILLFHQAGSNHYEYAPIAPKLVAAGFSCLAIDQRWGGKMWGHANETVKKLGHSETAADPIEYLEADLNAAWS